MHLAKQGVCVPAEHIFFPCTSGLTERRRGNREGRDGFGCRLGVECGLKRHAWHREASLLAALSFGSASLGAVFHL